MTQFKIDIGNQTENAVQVSVEKAFSSDFVFRSPERDDGKEVTDVLSLFDNVGLVIQCKAQALSPDGVESGESLKWATKNLAKAGRQVDGAVRTIRGGRLSHVENARRDRIPFNDKEFPFLYGLIVIHHSSEPYDPMELVPDLGKIQVPLHVISFRDFWNLSQFLDTPGDLINYLEHRTDVLIPTLNPKVHEEYAAFTYYLENLEDIMALRAEARGDAFTAQDAEPYARALRQIVARTHPDLKTGFVIDNIIEKIHDVDPKLEAFDIKGRILPRSDKTVYPKIAAALGKIPRVRRVSLGQHFVKIAKLAAEKGQMHYHLTHSRRRSDCMFFMASPLPQRERKKRAEELLTLTTLAKSYHQVFRAIGIATEPAGQMGSSYDMVMLEYPPVPDEKSRELGREMFGEGKTPLFQFHRNLNGESS